MAVYNDVRPPLTIGLLNAIKAMPGDKLCNAIYSGLADKPDVTPEELEHLSNRLGRLAWERARDTQS